MTALTDIDAAKPDATLHSGDDGSVFENFAPDIETLPKLRDGAIWRWSLVAAVLLHASMLVAFAYPLGDIAAGGGGTDLEAISVDVVSASAIDVIATPAVNKFAPVSAAELSNREGGEREQMAALEQPDQKKQQAAEISAKVEKPDIVIPDIVLKPEPPLPDVPMIVIASKAVEEPIEGPEKPESEKAKPAPTVAATPSMPTEAAVAEQIGGATSRGLSVVELAAQSAAIASAGELGAYARQVQLAVARNPPKPPRGLVNRGEVVVTFALALDGSIKSAGILSSSGNTTLDNAALAAVSSTKFPTPPAGSQPTQLVYKFPVKFR